MACSKSTGYVRIPLKVVVEQFDHDFSRNMKILGIGIQSFFFVNSDN